MYTASGKSEKSDLLTHYMPMVKRLAHHMMGRLPPSVEEDDLVQAGMIGLLDAISRYDDAQSAQFEAYAIQRIRGSMIDELRHSDWMPRTARQSMRKIEAAIGALQHKLGRQPSETEIAESMKMPGDTDEDDSFLDKQSANEASMPLPQLLDANLRACIIRGIEALPEREQLLMSLYYEQELNLREISEVFGVTESRICQLHGQAIARIRSKLKEDAWIGAA
ncbi:MAG: RNA polymerase sigma factor FliA [Hydrogenophilales bacterium 32-62-9]|nr:MAG: RNA polymerase sigma factor FliA [Hydrogenophilales bacterium 32-62-9]